jgi:hypothetical protein
VRSDGPTGQPAAHGRANGAIIASVGFWFRDRADADCDHRTRWGWRVALLISALPALCGILWLL